MNTLYNNKLLYILLVVIQIANAQIGYQENFSNGAVDWTGSGFETTSVGDCSGNGAIRARVNKSISQNKTITAISAPLGVSDGSNTLLEYNIRLLAYDAAVPQYALPDADFGRITLETGVSANEP